MVRVSAEGSPRGAAASSGRPSRGGSLPGHSPRRSEGRPAPAAPRRPRPGDAVVVLAGDPGSRPSRVLWVHSVDADFSVAALAGSPPDAGCPPPGTVWVSVRQLQRCGEEGWVLAKRPGSPVAPADQDADPAGDQEGAVPRGAVEDLCAAVTLRLRDDGSYALLCPPPQSGDPVYLPEATDCAAWIRRDHAGRASLSGRRPAAAEGSPCRAAGCHGPDPDFPLWSLARLASDAEGVVIVRSHPYVASCLEPGCGSHWGQASFEVSYTAEGATFRASRDELLPVRVPEEQLLWSPRMERGWVLSGALPECEAASLPSPSPRRGSDPAPRLEPSPRSPSARPPGRAAPEQQPGSSLSLRSPTPPQHAAGPQRVAVAEPAVVRLDCDGRFELLPYAELRAALCRELRAEQAAELSELRRTCEALRGELWAQRGAAADGELRGAAAELQAAAATRRALSAAAAVLVESARDSQDTLAAGKWTVTTRVVGGFSLDWDLAGLTVKRTGDWHDLTVLRQALQRAGGARELPALRGWGDEADARLGRGEEVRLLVAAARTANRAHDAAAVAALSGRGADARLRDLLSVAGVQVCGEVAPGVAACSACFERSLGGHGSVSGPLGELLHHLGGSEATVEGLARAAAEAATHRPNPAGLSGWERVLLSLVALDTDPGAAHTTGSPATLELMRRAAAVVQRGLAEWPSDAELEQGAGQPPQERGWATVSAAVAVLSGRDLDWGAAVRSLAGAARAGSVAPAEGSDPASPRILQEARRSASEHAVWRAIPRVSGEAFASLRGRPRGSELPFGGQPLSATLSRRVAESWLDGENGVLVKIRGVDQGVPLWDLSARPEDAEVLLPPMHLVLTGSMQPAASERRLLVLEATASGSVLPPALHARVSAAVEDDSRELAAIYRGGRRVRAAGRWAAARALAQLRAADGELLQRQQRAAGRRGELRRRRRQLLAGEESEGRQGLRGAEAGARDELASARDAARSALPGGAGPAAVAAAGEEAGEDLLEGELLVCEEGEFDSAMRCWCVLRPGELRCYDASERGRSLGTLQLDRSAAVAAGGRPSSFSLRVSGGRRRVELQPLDEAQTPRWLAALLRAATAAAPPSAPESGAASRSPSAPADSPAHRLRSIRSELSGGLSVAAELSALPPQLLPYSFTSSRIEVREPRPSTEVKSGMQGSAIVAAAIADRLAAVLDCLTDDDDAAADCLSDVSSDALWQEVQAAFLRRHRAMGDLRAALRRELGHRQLAAAIEQLRRAGVRWGRPDAGDVSRSVSFSPERTPAPAALPPRSPSLSPQAAAPYVGPVPGSPASDPGGFSVEGVRVVSSEECPPGGAGDGTTRFVVAVTAVSPGGGRRRRRLWRSWREFGELRRHCRRAGLDVPFPRTQSVIPNTVLPQQGAEDADPRRAALEAFLQQLVATARAQGGASLRAPLAAFLDPPGAPAAAPAHPHSPPAAASSAALRRALASSCPPGTLHPTPAAPAPLPTQPQAQPRRAAPRRRAASRREHRACAPAAAASAPAAAPQPPEGVAAEPRQAPQRRRSVRSRASSAALPPTPGGSAPQPPLPAPAPPPPLPASAPPPPPAAAPPQDAGPAATAAAAPTPPRSPTGRPRCQAVPPQPRVLPLVADSDSEWAEGTVGSLSGGDADPAPAGELPPKGAEVSVVGLRANAQLNGLRGRVHGFVVRGGAVLIHVSIPAADPRHQRITLRPRNIALAPPLPRTGTDISL
eukprot:TRINITY_DN6327_c0_g1_i2.p1 TRINITY_DN6327_c0_g1~~TRINITY_DN6327_c0_g1_i2.p1  ORF type:complete len:1750 (+),score=525.36 TRINITY_DN6327_c0_g1_i2:67-5250(+)